MARKSELDTTRPEGRLQAAREAAGYLTAKEFADKNGLQYGTYSTKERGKEDKSGRGMNRKHAQLYADLLKKQLPGITADWLLFGAGRNPIDGSIGVNTSPLDADLMASCIDRIIEFCQENDIQMHGTAVALTAIHLYQAYQLEGGDLDKIDQRLTPFIETMLKNNTSK